MKLNIQDLQKDLPLPALQVPWRPKFPTPFIPRGFPVSLMKFAAFHSRVHLIRKDQGTGCNWGHQSWRKSLIDFAMKPPWGMFHCFTWLPMNVCLGDCMPHQDLTKTQHFDSAFPTKYGEDSPKKYSGYWWWISHDQVTGSFCHGWGLKPTPNMGGVMVGFTCFESKRTKVSNVLSWSLVVWCPWDMFDYVRTPREEWIKDCERFIGVSDCLVDSRRKRGVGVDPEKS